MNEPSSIKICRWSTFLQLFKVFFQKIYCGHFKMAATSAILNFRIGSEAKSDWYDLWNISARFHAFTTFWTIVSQIDWTNRRAFWSFSYVKKMLKNICKKSFKIQKTSNREFHKKWDKTIKSPYTLYKTVYEINMELF